MAHRFDWGGKVPIIRVRASDGTKGAKGCVSKRISSVIIANVRNFFVKFALSYERFLFGPASVPAAV